MKHVRDRIERVAKARSEGGNLSKKLQKTPTEYHVTIVPDRPFLAIPETTTSARDYVPIGWLEPPVIPSNKLLVVLNAELWHFSLLTSAMHMAWIRVVSGRLGDEFQYSPGMVYNTFPLPNLDARKRKRLSEFAIDILAAREEFLGAELKHLYAPDLMPLRLRRVHDQLDRYVDRLYRRGGCAEDQERIEVLFDLYNKMTLTPKSSRVTKRRNS